MQKRFSLFDYIRNVKTFLNFTHTKVTVFFLPIAFSLCLVLVETISFIPLITLLRGIVQGDFIFFKESEFGEYLLSNFSGLINSDLSISTFLVLAVILLVLLKSICRYQAQVGYVKAVLPMISTLRERVFAQYLTFGKTYFDRTNVGQISRVINFYPNTIRDYLFQSREQLVSLILLMAYFILLIYLSLELTIFTILVGSILIFICRVLFVRFRIANKQNISAEREQMKKVTSALLSINLIKSHASEDYEKKLFHDRVDNINQSVRRVYVLQTISTISLDLFSTIGFLLVLMLGSFLVLEGDSRTLSYLFIFFLILKKAFTCLNSLIQTRFSYAQLADIFGEVKELFVHGNQSRVRSGQLEVNSLNEFLEFKNVSFQYPDSHRGVNNISFVLPKGKTLGIVGQSGAGKSTIIELLLRFYDCDSGEILIDHTNVQNIKIVSLMSRIALVGQVSVLFDGTIRDNLLYGLEQEPSDEKIFEVLNQVHMMERVNKLSDGIHTLVGHQGAFFSEGEKQRLSIARALLRQADILIFDEPTSSLDITTETEVFRIISDVIKDKTAIIITHKCSLLDCADKVLTIEHGKLSSL